MLSRRKFLVVSTVGISGLFSGCALNQPDFTVVIRNPVLFDPATLVIPVGSSVAWHNRADHVHTVTADPAKAQFPARILLPEGAPTFDSGDLFAGDRWIYTFEVAGMYTYFCHYHEAEGMLGTITVI